MKTGYLACVLLVLLTGSGVPVCADEAAIAIRAGHLIDTVAGRMTGAQVIVVRDGLIADVGPDVLVPPGARVASVGVWRKIVRSLL
jgi:hypothetical protein